MYRSGQGKGKGQLDVLLPSFVWGRAQPQPEKGRILTVLTVSLLPVSSELHTSEGHLLAAVEFRPLEKE